ncbi:MAG: FHA domain-containing protein [Planctomycetaceae bacterium]
MEVKLLVVNEKASVKELVLGPETFIGRSPECQLRIASTRVSRKHCVIVVTEKEVTVRDLNSANGTVLDGLTVAAGVDARVRPGSKLIVGPMKFVFDFEPPETVDPAEGYVSPTDVLALAGDPGDEDDTKDYVPPKARRAPAAPPDKPAGAEPKGEKAGLEVRSGLPRASGPVNQPAPAPPPLNPDDTIFDPGLADHAREAARRARDDSASIFSDSGTDLLNDEATPVGDLAQTRESSADDVAEDAALKKFFQQFDS